jgi:hypothetical protein
VKTALQSSKRVLTPLPITVPTLIEDAVGHAFTAWLNANRDILLEKIADKVARKLGDDRKEPS